MQKKGVTTFEKLLFLTAALVLFAFFWPHPHGSRENAKRSSCQSNLKQIALSMRQYLEDHDERFPSFGRNGRLSWAVLLNSYLKNRPLFQCPSGNSESADTTDYFYNSRLSNQVLKSLDSPAQTILFGEALDGSPPNCAYDGFSPELFKDAPSAGRRHMDGANYAFADGHVKWFIPEKLAMKEASGPTFLTRF